MRIYNRKCTPEAIHAWSSLALVIIVGAGLILFPDHALAEWNQTEARQAVTTNMNNAFDLMKIGAKYYYYLCAAAGLIGAMTMGVALMFAKQYETKNFVRIGTGLLIVGIASTVIGMMLGVTFTVT